MWGCILSPMKLHWLLAVTITDCVSRVPQQLWARISGSRVQQWTSKLPCLLPAAQPVSAINCRVIESEKVMEAKPQQCSFENRVVICYKHHWKWRHQMMVYLDPMDDIYLDFHSISTWKKPTFPPECCLLHSRLLTVVWMKQSRLPINFSG